MSKIEKQKTEKCKLQNVKNRGSFFTFPVPPLNKGQKIMEHSSEQATFGRSL